MPNFGERMNAAARVGNQQVEQFCNACFTGNYRVGIQPDPTTQLPLFQ